MKNQVMNVENNSRKMSAGKKGRRILVLAMAVMMMKYHTSTEFFKETSLRFLMAPPPCALPAPHGACGRRQ